MNGKTALICIIEKRLASEYAKSKGKELKFFNKVFNGEVGLIATNGLTPLLSAVINHQLMKKPYLDKLLIHAGKLIDGGTTLLYISRCI